MLYLISLLSFLLPTQLSYHLTSFSQSVYGFNIDYLTPAIYLTDIVVFVIIFLGRKNLKPTKKQLILVLGYLSFAAINIFISSYKIASLYKWIKITELILLGLVIIKNKKFDIFKNFVKPLSYSVAVTCLLGIAQFLNKGSIGGIFYWLGERNFIFNDPNIAPYPYATFSHPNSFAGFLLVFSLFLLQYKKKFNVKYFWSLVILVSTNLVLTNSLNVYIAIAVLLFLKIRGSFALGFLSFDLGQRFITHRIELINASLKLIKESFLLGVGLNNFIPNLVKVSNTFVNSWELQPVHNIFLLIFSETGIIGISAFLYLVLVPALLTNLSLIAILITGLSDHYWITLQQNMLLLTFVLALSKIRGKR